MTEYPLLGSDHVIEFHAPDDYRFRHLCARTSPRFTEPQEPRLLAPLLSKHQVHVDTENEITVSPSILCSDCGVHGFVRSSLWVAT